MRVPPRWLLRLAQGVGIVWALPVTAIGLAAGLAALAAGARMHLSRRDLACVFQQVPWGPGGALTLGNVILDTGVMLDRPCNTYAHDAGHRHEPRVLLADHERAHVLQYMALGVLFLPLYLLHGGVVASNPFERAADRYARTGRGWWPWARD
ncbi:MAG TPA: hypothetical protein VGE33_12135 [Thermomonas sp.]